MFQITAATNVRRLNRISRSHRNCFAITDARPPCAPSIPLPIHHYIGTPRTDMSHQNLICIVRTTPGGSVDESTEEPQLGFIDNSLSLVLSQPQE